jgi:hypothetical protein
MTLKLSQVANYIIDSKFIPTALNAARVPAIIANQAVSTLPNNNTYPAIQNNYVKDEPLGLSSLNTPIYTDLSLLGCQYTDNITNQLVVLANDRFRAGGTAQSSFYLNLESILIQVTQNQRVIKTEIQGRNGTVKEYIGADDLQITVNGVLTGRNGQYPKEDVIRLKKWLDAPLAKGVTAWWLNNLGVNNIVVESYSIPQQKGGYSYQVFSFNAVADTPVELRIVGQ